MRLFLALDIDDEIRGRLVRFMDGVRDFAPDARWVKPESLHVTLKFIGEVPEIFPDRIRQGLQGVHVHTFQLRFQGYGFFPSSKATRVFWVGIDAESQLGELARAINASLEKLGIAKDEHAFSPHLTLARGAGRSGVPHRRGEDSPNKVFQVLQKHLAALPQPDFGSMTANEFYLYQSQLSPKGSKYTKLEQFGLS
ncbi:MAG TPA: RNA 2',3'-cyclic phosphodiesterase [Candidatus Sulfotelmatobacter sp.]|nr:RNA 2',3'-cyclic phosphodiesterase [Candidatus Sulfotelmatobacter sp.]